jgi:hypothetical protein
LFLILFYFILLTNGEQTTSVKSESASLKLYWTKLVQAKREREAKRERDTVTLNWTRRKGSYQANGIRDGSFRRHTVRKRVVQELQSQGKNLVGVLSCTLICQVANPPGSLRPEFSSEVPLLLETLRSSIGNATVDSGVQALVMRHLQRLAKYIPCICLLTLNQKPLVKQHLEEIRDAPTMECNPSYSAVSSNRNGET